MLLELRAEAGDALMHSSARVNFSMIISKGARRLLAAAVALTSAPSIDSELEPVLELELVP